MSREWICLAVLQTSVSIAVNSVSVAQPHIDASLHAGWLQESDTYGVGGSVHFATRSYVFEVVPSVKYYFAENDTTNSWSVEVDGRLNLPAVGRVRPYGAAGIVRLRHDDASEWLLNLAGGVHVRLWGDRVYPFAEAAYRPGDSDNEWRYRAGLRFILRADRSN